MVCYTASINTKKILFATDFSPASKVALSNLRAISHQMGIPSHVVLGMAEDFDYALIVVGAKGQSKLQCVLMGSTAEKILRFSPYSLLVVR